jgi:hypothetical protein
MKTSKFTPELRERAVRMAAPLGPIILTNQPRTSS